MTIPRMLRITAIATAALVLAGCGRFHVNLEINDDNTLSGEIVVAMLVGDDENAEQNALSAADEVEQRLLPGLREADGVTQSHYDDEGYVGSRLVLARTPIEALEGSEAFSLERDGDVFQFSGTLELAPEHNDDATAEDTAEEDVVPDDGERDVVVSLRFPGEVTSHNGEASGTTVTWGSDWSGALDMRATAMAESDGAPVWAWVAGGLVALLLVGAVVAAVVIGRGRTGVQQTGTVPPAM